MDFISTLIEENTARAIAINQVLVKNEKQLQNIEQEQESMTQQNNYISQLLNSWSGFLNRIWNYSGKKSVHNKLAASNFKYELEKNKLVDLSDNNYTSLELQEEHLVLEKIAPLKEIAGNISKNLDRQNQMLSDIKNKNNQLATQIENNQDKIQRILVN